jgi:hypothetical protein
MDHIKFVLAFVIVLSCYRDSRYLATAVRVKQADRQHRVTNSVWSHVVLTIKRVLRYCLRGTNTPELP